MKKIQIRYLEIEQDIDRSLVEVSIDYPKFKKCRTMYMYELDFFAGLQGMVLNIKEEGEIYDLFEFVFTPNTLKLSNELFEELKDYLDNNKTEYEQEQFDEDLKMLLAKVSLYKLSPESWNL